ncbi:immunoglobulin-like domain-containing receptor 2 isoform X9 [Ascaphus truei]|uniref:immunoglobulin-like domain-containing receptor 2 isoform X9 n=1 Tax=Ascaphus truei TaxID=8439 RepID=UPI003F5A9245
MAGIILGCITLLCVTAVASGVKVTMPENKKVAMLFQPELLRCHYSTSSTQAAVVQWRYKSYCQDRMEEALGMGNAGLQAMSKRNLGWDPYLDCVDGGRTVRIVASKQGSTVTLGDFYKGRDITIVHDADLQFGKLQWGDSGLYYCLVVASDDLEGKNEDRVELLVMVYEAGKAAKGGYPPAVPTNCPPYYISTVPVAPVPAPMLMEKQHVPPLVQSDSLGGQNALRKGYRIQADKERDSMKVLYYVEKELAQFDPARRMRERCKNYSHTISELSSLHEDSVHFNRSYRQVRRQPLPSSCNVDGDAEYWSGVVGATARPSACSKFREERESFRSSLQRPTSEVLERKAFPMAVQAVSTDELAAFADSYKQRSRRADSRGPGSGSRFERSEVRGRSVYQDSSPDEYYGKRNHGRELFSDTERGWSFSPSRIRAPEDKHLPKRITRMGQSYDDAYLSSVLERKSRCLEETSATPSKLSLRQNSSRSYGRSPTFKTGEGKDQKVEEEDSLPPYSERELARALPFRSREHSYLSASDKRKKKEQPSKTVRKAFFFYMNGSQAKWGWRALSKI